MTLSAEKLLKSPNNWIKKIMRKNSSFLMDKKSLKNLGKNMPIQDKGAVILSRKSQFLQLTTLIDVIRYFKSFYLMVHKYDSYFSSNGCSINWPCGY